ncbi:MAG: oligoendopeptidase F, partial [Clostridiales bacterium]|nr:oligoendopeptidase F [Clostridiales bacterium]
LYLYAFLRHDEDIRVTKYNAYVSKVMSLMTKLGAETAFATPELTALPEEKLHAFATDSKLQDYDYFFKRLIAKKEHVLSEPEEKILAQTGEPMETAHDVFNMLDDAELNLPEIEYEGEKTPLSHGLYSVIMSGHDGKKRGEAFGLYYSAYRKIINTLATTYFGNVKKDIFYKNVRGYKSCLEMALSEEDVARRGLTESD